MNIKIKITNKSNAKELDVNIESIIEIDLEDYVFCCVAGEIGNAIYDACRAQAIASRTLAYYHHTKGNIISDDSTGATCLWFIASEGVSVLENAAELGVPIPYSGNMTLTSGLYYMQDWVIYKCTRDTGNPVYHALDELVGCTSRRLDAQ